MNEIEHELRNFADYSRRVAAGIVADGPGRLTWQERAEWADRAAEQLRGAVHSYEELRGWVTEALNLPGQPSGQARRALLNGLNGTTRTEEES